MQITTSTDLQRAPVRSRRRRPIRYPDSRSCRPVRQSARRSADSTSRNRCPLTSSRRCAMRGQNTSCSCSRPGAAEEQFIAAAEIFGTLKEAGSRKYLLQGGKKAAHFLSKHPVITVLSNLDENGKPVKENVMLGSLEVEWHSDNSYVEVAYRRQRARSQEIPPMAAATHPLTINGYDELPTT